ncbi:MULTISPECIES: YdcH family protein [unclassified Rhodosalinus]|uniref:YdcH family protein n=1 Tax=unclassified Rhodosalinus TaxID=2630183 RepID=UPI0035234470
MSHTPHELHEEFPEFAEKISALKQSDAHFAKLADRYHDLNRQVHRAETNVEPVEELAEMQLRKERAGLKDEIYAYLKAGTEA